MRSIRSHLLASAAVAAMLAISAAQSAVVAQEAGATDDNELIVFGQRWANIIAIETKRNADGIVEVSSEDDLGKLPDNNLGESLGRLPGVSTILDEGVGRYVAIRGLGPDFVNATIDGVTFAATARTWEDPGRAFNMETINQDFISRVEVYKTITADMDADALAGTVNLVSKSAFDLKPGQQFYTSVDGAVGFNSSDELPFSSNSATKRFKMLHAGKFGANHEFGYVVSGSYKEDDKDVLKEGVHSWGPTLPSGQLAPDGLWDTLIHETGEKLSLSAKLEYKPSDNFYAYGSVVYADESHLWNNGAHQLWRSGSYDEANGAIDGWAGIIGHKLSDFGTDTLTYSGGMDWRIDQVNRLEFKAARSNSDSYLDEQRVQWIGNWGGLDGTYTVNGRDFRYQLDDASAARFNDAATYNLDNMRDIQNEASTEVDGARLDWSHNVDGALSPWGFKAGAAVKLKDYSFTESYLRADRYRNREGGGPFNEFIDQYGYRSPTTSNPLLFGNVPGFLDHLGANYGGTEEFIRDNFGRIRTDYSNAKDLETEEDVKAGYGMVVFNGTKLKAKAGLRYEHTKWSGRNRLAGEEDAAFVNHGSSYDHLLPSIVASYDLTADFKVRGAFSQTIGRPGMNQYAAFESQPNEQTGIFYRSNPDLQPRESDNFDVAMEYYMDGGKHLFSLGYFAKNIKNEIYDKQTAYDYDDGNGNVIPSYFIQPDNAGSGKIRGIEANLIVTTLDFVHPMLAGFGFSANATWQDGELEIAYDDGIRTLGRMPKTPEQMYNLALTYNANNIDARLTYQFVGKRTLSIAGGVDATEKDDLVREATQRVDLHLGYRVTEQTKAYVDIWNLTGEKTQDRGNAFWDEATKYGTAYWFGIKSKF